MSKKSAQWITIPEASLHTPVSGVAKAPPSKAGKTELVKNKLFWGIGFVVVVVAAFAVLAPTQFSKLLQGNVLFDSPGVSGTDTTALINPLNLLPQQGGATKPSDATVTPPASQGSSATPPADQGTSASDSGTSQDSLKPSAPEAPSAPANPPQAEPVVKPQDQPINVAVEPIVTPEPVVVAPIVTGPLDCKSDMACLLPKLADCSLAKGLFAYQAMGQSVEVSLELTGSEGANCLVKAIITKVPMPDLVGKDAVCKLPKGVYTQDSLQAQFSDPAKLSEACSGSAVDSLKGLLGSPVAVDTQSDLVAQLKKQVEELQAQKDQSNKLMLDLVNEVQTQKGAGIYPAAPGAAVGTGLPTGMVGQANTVQPGFRANPYRVTVTPEQMLQQRLAGASSPSYGSTGSATYPYSGTQISGSQNYQPTYGQGTQSSNGQNYQTSSSGNLVRGTNTPQTGPEATAIVLFAAFVALVFWKFMRTFAK